MSTAYSVAEVLEKLEKRIAFHREQADHHAQQEIHHREQNALHLAELKRVTEHFEAFKGTALTAAELAGEATAPPPPVQEEAAADRDLTGREAQASKLVMKVVEGMADGASFGAAQVAAETNRLYRGKLRRPLKARDVSVTLRRLREAGRLRLVRGGKANQEAIYAKRARPASNSPAKAEAPEG
jgi:hypothetical protein